MRDTIDFGIDLGTTNSEIAVVRDGTPTVIKNNENAEFTPSAVWMPRAGRIHVGLQARQQVIADPDNTAAEFKLEMGLADARRTFARAGVSLTPPELSAEVLRSLRADAAHALGEVPDAAVITVPAAFTLNQNKATADAAQLAGFDVAAPLVQEPTAAAIAYGLREASERAYWLVFDLGGGTFDAAVVSKHDGDLRVINHAGDSHLGGKDIDWAIVEHLLAPAVATEFGLDDFRRANTAWRATFAKLKGAAERAKIQLSRLDRYLIDEEIVDAGGELQPFEYELTRDRLDELAEPFYTKAVRLCRRALEDAALGVADIDRVLLVGGATQSPGLRRRLSDGRHGLGIELDHSVDPTTVVAQGAAMFAGTLRRPAAPVRPSAPDEFGLTLAYSPHTTTTTPTVAGSFESTTPVDWSRYRVTLSNPSGRPPFHSGDIALNPKGAFATEVVVDENRSSTFHIELRDDTGAPCRLAAGTQDSVSFTHADVEPGAASVTHSLGIQLADRKFARILEKGAALPAKGRKPFRTNKTLYKASRDTMVAIPVVQGEHPRGDRNREVGVLEIRPRDVGVDLPAGTEVEVEITVDQAGLVSVLASVPLVDIDFEARIDMDHVSTPDPDALRGRLHDAERRLSAVRDAIADAPPSTRERLDRLDGEDTVTACRDLVAAAAEDKGAADAADKQIRDLQAELDEIEGGTKVPELVDDVRGMLDAAGELMDRTGTAADQRELDNLRGRLRAATDAGDAVALEDLRESAGRLLGDLETRSPDWPVRRFQILRHLLGAEPRAASLIREGEAAMRARDLDRLEAVSQRLVRLVPEDQKDSVIGLLPR